MVRLQYKICTSVPLEVGGYCDVHVYGREVQGDGEPGPWHHVVGKHTWVDPLFNTHGQRLRALLRSLA